MVRRESQGPSSISPALMGSMLESWRVPHRASVSLLYSSPHISHQVDSRAETWGNQPHPPRGRFWVFILIDIIPPTKAHPLSQLPSLIALPRGGMRQLTQDRS